ncbi:MAG TPA: nucleotide exchange factor GrpE, partial [Acidobacteriota bacterium]|nr:nucleotide exchange factor GrpE [Acidobacteriota bacterium]
PALPLNPSRATLENLKTCAYFPPFRMSETSQTDTSKTTPPTPETAAAKPAEATKPAASAPSADEQLAAARAEAAAAQERYLRSVADLENFRKRVVREKDELRQFAAANVVEDLIPILDNLGLGLAAAKQQSGDTKSIVDGVGMVLEQFKAALGRHGLKEINPVGAAFDPHQHDCISHQPDAQVPEEKVISVVRLGYSLNGRLLRPASVIVSSGPAKPETKA